LNVEDNTIAAAANATAPATNNPPAVQRSPRPALADAMSGCAAPRPVASAALRVGMPAAKAKTVQHMRRSCGDQMEIPRSATRSTASPQRAAGQVAGHRRKARQLARHLRGERPDYAYLKEVFRHLREELDVEVTRTPKKLPYVPTEAETTTHGPLSGARESAVRLTGLRYQLLQSRFRSKWRREGFEWLTGRVSAMAAVAVSDRAGRRPVPGPA
jgi:hypothetical protein